MNVHSHIPCSEKVICSFRDCQHSFEQVGLFTQCDTNRLPNTALTHTPAVPCTRAVQLYLSDTTVLPSGTQPSQRQRKSVCIPPCCAVKAHPCVPVTGTIWFLWMEGITLWRCLRSGIVTNPSSSAAPSIAS